MTFLAPSVLWLLGAISIPIAIHLLSRLQTNKVEFSTIRFIKQLETSSIRKVQLEKLLLLLLRILAIAALVLMMSQPVTTGFMPGWIAAEQDARLIMVIDNSASMNVNYENKTFLERSKNELMSVLPIFKEETLISIVKTCPLEEVFRGYSNDPRLRTSVKSIMPTAGHDNIWNSINLLLKDEGIIEPIKECVVFSDLMHQPDSTFISGIKKLEDWKFYFIQPQIVYDNLGIMNVSPISRIKTTSQLVKLNTRVKNSGLLKRPSVPLELLFNEQRVGQVVTEFDPDKEKEFLFQAYPGQVGIVKARIELPKDNYELDNSWYLSMPIMDEISCGIIGANNEDIILLEMVLRAIDPKNEFLTIESRIQPDINRLYLDGLDVVLIHNSKGLTEEGVKDLEKFVTEGGGVVWFQGESDEEKFHSDLYDQLGFPKTEGIMNAGQGFFSTKIAGDGSDLLDNIQVRDISKELPEIFKYNKVSLSLDQEAHWILNNGDPLLIELKKGTGSIFYFSTLLDLRWNDLPVRGMVVPLLYRIMVLTGTDEVNTAAVLINEEKWISIEESKLLNTWEVVSPSGKKELIVPDYDREGISIIKTDELGIYQVFSNGNLFTSFPTRLHYQEYIQERISQKDIELFVPQDQVRWLTLQNKFADIFLDARQGKSLWKFFLIAAIIFLLAEMIISRPIEGRMKTETE